jgi:uncharacterized protein
MKENDKSEPTTGRNSDRRNDDRRPAGGNNKPNFNRKPQEAPETDIAIKLAALKNKFK